MSPPQGPPPPTPDPVPPPVGPPDDGNGRLPGLVRSPAGVPFTVVDAGVALLAFFLGQVVVGLAAGVYTMMAGAELGDVGWLVVVLVGTVLGLLFALGWLAARGRLDRSLIGRTPTGLLVVAMGIAAGLAGTIVTYGLNWTLAAVFRPETPVEQQVLQDALDGGASLVVALLIAVVAAPVAEEVLFRGLLFRSMRSRIGLWPAAVLSSVVFVLIHVEIVVSQPLALAGLFAFSMVLAWSFDRVGNLWVPIVGHAVFNAVSLTLLLALDRVGLV